MHPEGLLLVYDEESHKTSLTVKIRQAREERRIKHFIIPPVQIDIQPDGTVYTWSEDDAD